MFRNDRSDRKKPERRRQERAFARAPPVFLSHPAPGIARLRIGFSDLGPIVGSFLLGDCALTVPASGRAVVVTQGVKPTDCPFCKALNQIRPQQGGGGQVPAKRYARLICKTVGTGGLQVTDPPPRADGRAP